jgi:hypothetical protein
MVFNRTGKACPLKAVRISFSIELKITEGVDERFKVGVNQKMG